MPSKVVSEHLGGGPRRPGGRVHHQLGHDRDATRRSVDGQSSRKDAAEAHDASDNPRRSKREGPHRPMALCAPIEFAKPSLMHHGPDPGSARSRDPRPVITGRGYHRRGSIRRRSNLCGELHRLLLMKTVPFDSITNEKRVQDLMVFKSFQLCKL